MPRRIADGVRRIVAILPRLAAGTHGPLRAHGPHGARRSTCSRPSCSALGQGRPRRCRRCARPTSPPGGPPVVDAGPALRRDMRGHRDAPRRGLRRGNPQEEPGTPKNAQRGSQRVARGVPGVPRAVPELSLGAAPEGSRGGEHPAAVAIVHAARPSGGRSRIGQASYRASHLSSSQLPRIVTGSEHVRPRQT